MVSLAVSLGLRAESRKRPDRHTAQDKEYDSRGYANGRKPAPAEKLARSIDPAWSRGQDGWCSRRLWMSLQSDALAPRVDGREVRSWCSGNAERDARLQTGRFCEVKALWRERCCEIARSSVES